MPSLSLDTMVRTGRMADEPPKPPEAEAESKGEVPEYPPARIRGDNPPRYDVGRAYELEVHNRIFYGLTAVVVLGMVATLFFQEPIPGARSWLLVGLVAAAVYLIRKIRKNKKLIEECLKPRRLRLYDTEFIIPRLDGRPVRIKVAFEIPVAYVEMKPQLDLATEKILLKYASTCTEPRSITDIEEHLNEALFPFQQENDDELPILRVQVPLATLIEPPAQRPPDRLYL
jgi:hypothetical protein